MLRRKTTSQNLTQEAEAARNKMASLSVAAFDKACIDNEVAYHKTVNTALSDTLIPDAQNADLKALLQKGLTLLLTLLSTKKPQLKLSVLDVAWLAESGIL